MSKLHVHFLPSLVEPAALAGHTVVVIDVLRATTTIAAAIAAGAREVIPCGEVDEARTIAARFAPGTAILGGERGGLLIPGFDLGNSPSHYTPERVGGKTIIFTTTNGTQAMLRCTRAARVLTAGFVNVSAIAQAVRNVAQAAAAPERIHLLCAGTRGQITSEDVLLAGCLAELINATASDAGKHPSDGDDQAQIALAAWLPVKRSARRASDGGKASIGEIEFGALVPSATLLTALEQSRGGKDLCELGLAADIADAAQIDWWDCVPELNLSEWTIRNG